MLALECKKLSKVYHVGKTRRVVLDEVDLQVEMGKKLAILGRNGAGKSTLIKMLGGVEYPTAGVIKKNVTVSWPLAFGGAFQGSLSGHDNLKFVCRIYDLDYKDTLAYVEDFAQLGRQFYDPVKTYSSGMHARLAFALSLAIEFDCYLIDEVIMVGDARFIQRCEDELFNKRGDRTLIVVSHNMDFLKNFCDEAVLIHDKKIHRCNSLDEGIDRYYSL